MLENTSNKTDKLESRLNKGTKQIFVWTLAWLLSNALVIFGAKLLWDNQREMTVAAIALNLILGIKLIFVFKNHLKDMDELQRKIHFNAMAISLGSTMIFGNAFGFLAPTGLIENTPSPSNLLIIMGISYIVAVIVNYRRYQ